MLRLIEERELVEFFGAEPRLLDAGVPWAYNTLTFRGADWSVVIVPGEEEVRLEHRCDR